MAQLTEICAYLKNYFLNGDKAKSSGTFTIISGAVPLESLLEGQYFCIVGSVLNDGVWQNVSTDLANLRAETFTGQIWSMSVPRDFEQLCEDIATWRTTNEAATSSNMSPYQSESFGGYSYSKGGGSSSNSGNAVTWQSQFAQRLSTYRRISI